jgi:hypothetical protein
MNSRVCCIPAICTLAIFQVESMMAQTLDPTRLGEGVRPLNVPGLLDQEKPIALGLEDENPFAPASPGDDDSGQQLILKDSPRERWWSAQFDSFAYWTDNPANLPTGGEEDVFWGSQLRLGAQPRLMNRLYADLSVSQQVYRYDEFDFLDYEFFETSLGLIYVEPRLWNSILFAQARYSRMTTDDFGEDVFNSFSLRGGIQKSILFDRRNSLYLNLMGDFDLDTDVRQLDRFEYIADLGYSFKIMRDLVVSASYRFTWFDYRKVDRADALHLIGANLTWSPRKWIDIYLAGTFSINESNVDVFDYEAANVGGGAGVRIRF